jgi:DNA-binding transcriptional LysR family regulator
MNLSQLRFIVAVADSMSFSQAAKTCCVTQPTLSNGVAQLEEELGARLFDRTTRKVQLTPFGEHVLPSIRAVLDAQHELERGAEAYLEPALKMICIGQSPLVDTSLITMVLEPFKRRHTDVDIFFKECYLGDLDERIDQETVDFGLRPVMTSQPKIIRQMHCPFYDDGLYLLRSDVVPVSRPLPKGARLGAIATDTFVLTPDGCGLAGITEGLFKQHHLKLKKYPGQAHCAITSPMHRT